MATIPLTPHLKSYRGAKQDLQRKTAEKNQRYHRIADYVNHLIANDPRPSQQYLFALIAAELKVDVQDVRFAISDGGYNGITLQIFDNDRPALERYKKQPLR